MPHSPQFINGALAAHDEAAPAAGRASSSRRVARPAAACFRPSEGATGVPAGGRSERVWPSRACERRDRLSGGTRGALGALLLAGAAATLTACDAGLAQIDRKTLALLEEGTSSVHADVLPSWPMRGVPAGSAGPIFGPDPVNLVTINPPADQLEFTPRADESEAALVESIDRGAPATAVVLDLPKALAYAVAHSREYQNAAEAYIIAALQVIIERHLWGPRFFNETQANFTAGGDQGVYNAAVQVVNDFNIRQRLPYGGEVSASLLAQAIEDLHQAVAGENVQSADLVLEANIPLLRGAGLAAREDLIQTERNLIYAAREFERFRRRFVFDIASDYLELVVQRQEIDNAERQVLSLEAAEARERALFEAGRQAGFQLGLAAQDTLFARDRLAAQREQYRVAVDRFKLRIGMPTSQPLAIDYDDLGLPPPQVNAEEAVATGLRLRLDLQNIRDQFQDSRRRVDVAHNQLLPDLNLNGAVSVPTDPEEPLGGISFNGENTTFVGGITFNWPLDREIERARLRQAQLQLERAGRAYSEARDQIAIEIRSAVRQIDRAIFSIRLQEENVRIARLREASIDAAPDRASARDRSDAIQARLQAEDGLARARRDLQVAVLGYLLATDQLRVDSNGEIIPLKGMNS